MNVRGTVKSIQDIMWKDVGVDGDAQRISQLCWMIFLKIIDDQDQELDLTRDGYRSPIPEKFQWRSWAAERASRRKRSLMSGLVWSANLGIFRAICRWRLGS